MVEQNAVASKDAVSLAIIYRCVVCENFGTGVRGSWIERSSFGLRCFNYFAKHFRRGSLIKLRMQSEFANCLKKSDCANSCNVCCVLGDIKTDANMRLGA